MWYTNIEIFFRDYFFLKEGGPQLTDVLTIIPFIGFFLILRAAVTAITFSVYPYIIRITSPSIDSKDFEVKRNRLADQCVKLTFHLMAALFASLYFGNFDWWIPNLMNFNAYLNVSLKVMDKVYYMYQAGYHSHSLVHFFFLETHRKADDFVMGLHHIVTIILIFLSYLGGSPYFHIGATVFYVHDASDVSIALVKSMNYLGFPRPVLFVFLFSALASWIYFRIFTFGIHIILVSGLGSYIEFLRMGLFNSRVLIGSISVLMLGCLWMMHCYWLWAIIQSLQRVSGTKSGKELDASDAGSESLQEKELKQE